MRDTKQRRDKNSPKCIPLLKLERPYSDALSTLSFSSLMMVLGLPLNPRGIWDAHDPGSSFPKSPVPESMIGHQAFLPFFNAPEKGCESQASTTQTLASTLPLSASLKKAVRIEIGSSNHRPVLQIKPGIGGLIGPHDPAACRVDNELEAAVNGGDNTGG